MSSNVNVYELADEIENMVEEFLNNEKQYRVLRAKRKMSFTESQIWDLINEILEYYELTDSFEMVMDSDPYDLKSYKMFEFRLKQQEEMIALVRIFFEKHSGGLYTLRKIEMFKLFKNRGKA